MKKSLKVLGKKCHNKIWKKSHDVVEREVKLHELYNNVPKDLKNINVSVLEVHSFSKKDKDKVLNWLNR